MLQPAPKQPASFLGVISEKILEIFLLLIFTIFVQKLNNSQINGFSQSSTPLKLTQAVSLIKKTLKQFFSSFDFLHVKVKFVPFIFSFEQVDLVSIFIPDAEILALLRTKGNRKPFVIGNRPYLRCFSWTYDRIEERQGDITWRCSICMTEVDISQRFVPTLLPPVQLPGFHNLFQVVKMNLLKSDVVD